MRGPKTAGSAIPIQTLKKTKKEGPALIFSDEASFRQDSTLHATWSRVGHGPEVPVTGQRKSVKILGAIDLWDTRFHYRQEPGFHGFTSLVFFKQPAKKARRRGA